MNNISKFIAAAIFLGICLIGLSLRIAIVAIEFNAYKIAHNSDVEAKIANEARDDGYRNATLDSYFLRPKYRIVESEDGKTILMFKLETGLEKDPNAPTMMNPTPVPPITLNAKTKQKRDT